MPALLIETIDYNKFLPVSRTKNIWDITCGIYNPRQRFEIFFPGSLFHSPRFNEKPFSLLKNEYPEKACYNPDSEVDAIINSQYIPSGNYSRNMNTLSIT